MEQTKSVAIQFEHETTGLESNLIVEWGKDQAHPEDNETFVQNMKIFLNQVHELAVNGNPDLVTLDEIEESSLMHVGKEQWEHVSGDEKTLTIVGDIYKFDREKGKDTWGKTQAMHKVCLWFVFSFTMFCGV